MVKNTGGNKSKKLGRKYTSESAASRPLREAQSEEEVYAIVVKCLGHGMCDVKDHEGKNYLCIIRNKFRGRGKRDNMINVGTWVLIGIRSYETISEGKKQKSDLLEVYNENEKTKLKKTGNKIFDNLKIDNASYQDGDSEIAWEFQDGDTVDIEQYTDHIEDKNESFIDTGEEINIDDI